MMAEDFVEDLLEAPFKEKGKSKERERERKHSPSRSHKDRSRRSRSREKTRSKRSRSKDHESRKRRSPSREGSREKRSAKPRSRSRERNDRDRDRRDHRRRSPPRFERGWGRGRGGGRYDRSRSRSPRNELAPEERDQRTVFCMQLAARIRSRDLEEFFSAVGKVREVRLIMDNKTRRHKGIAYIEFQEISSVNLALALNGQKLCGVPVIIQPTQAEKNRAAASASAIQRGITGPMRLYVGSLHFNITEDMLRGIFEPFGRIEKIELMRDPENNRSKGYGFITFFDSDDAKKALDQLNGFELAGRPMKVNHVTERSDVTFQGPSMLDSDDMDRSGIDLGTTGRLQLMAKLAEGTGIQLPQAAMTALQMGHAVASMPPSVAQSAAIAAANTMSGASNGATPAIATQCFMLTNMFDPTSESTSTWAEDIRNDVIEECRKSGGAFHVFVDRESQGNVYVKCPTISAASGCVNALHGRWFSGRMVTAAYVPVASYHNLFPDSVNITSPL